MRRHASFPALGIFRTFYEPLRGADRRARHPMSSEVHEVYHLEEVSRTGRADAAFACLKLLRKLAAITVSETWSVT